MATILLTWELGAALGHLTNLVPLGAELVRRGHRVVAAVRDLSRVGEMRGTDGISWMPAPIIPRQGPPPYASTDGYAQVLGNTGFASESVLSTLLGAWNTILDLVRPDLVVADHSPTALLALRGRSTCRVMVGNGFFCPPDKHPMPIWLPPQNPRRAKAERDEQEITEAVNRVLTAQRRPRLERLGQLFSEVDEVFLATYRELDQLGPRPRVRYWGHWPYGAAVAPQWPAGEGPKVYAYLKPFPALEELLTALKEQGLPTLLYAGGIAPAVQERFGCSTMRFERRPLDLRQAAAQCDLAILNATHGATAAFLLAGKPCLLAPLFLEQLLTARKAEQIGAARLLGKEGEKTPVGQVLREMVGDASYGVQARKFAVRYAGSEPGRQVPEVVDHLERLCRGRVVRLVRLPAR